MKSYSHYIITFLLIVIIVLSGLLYEVIKTTDNITDEKKKIGKVYQDIDRLPDSTWALCTHVVYDGQEFFYDYDFDADINTLYKLKHKRFAEGIKRIQDYKDDLMLKKKKIIPINSDENE